MFAYIRKRENAIYTRSHNRHSSMSRLRQRSCRRPLPYMSSTPPQPPLYPSKTHTPTPNSERVMNLPPPPKDRRLCVQGIFDGRLSLENSPLQYLLTYKLSQYHLERLFSCAVRSACGSNNTPTAKQFATVH